jgi:hypothetical protein
MKANLTDGLKRTIVDLLIISAAVIGGTFLLKKADEAGAGKAMPALPPSTHQITEPDPVRPQIIVGRVDNFKEAIIPKTIRSWDTRPRDVITLRVSPDATLNHPSARVLMVLPTTAPLILEIQYTVDETTIKMLSANDDIKNRTDGVTILVSTVGIAYNHFTLLNLDPLRIAEQRKWLTHNLALPPGTREVDFSIIGPPPDYNVFGDSCVIYLPQLRIASPK